MHHYVVLSYAFTIVLVSFLLSWTHNLARLTIHSIVHIILLFSFHLPIINPLLDMDCSIVSVTSIVSCDISFTYRSFSVYKSCILGSL